MKIEEAIYCMTSYLPDNEVEHCVNCSYYPNNCKSDVAHKMAIRSIEAWRKLDNEVYGCICEYEGLNAYKTDAWYDGRVEGMKMIQHIIKKHLKEVEE